MNNPFLACRGLCQCCEGADVSVSLSWSTPLSTFCLSTLHCKGRLTGPCWCLSAAPLCLNAERVFYARWNLLSLPEESQVGGCDPNKCSPENVFWQKTLHIVQITNCTQFSGLAAWFLVLELLIASTVTIQRNIFHAKRKVAVASI